MYLDASAIVAILANEFDGGALTRRIPSSSVITSPISLLEATLSLARGTGGHIAAAEASVDAFLATVGANVISVTPEIGRGAVAAYAIYGRGYNSRAALNMGDAFAYACAKAHRVPLLYKGDDFSHTDLG